MNPRGKRNCLRGAGPRLPQGPASSWASWPWQQEMGMADNNADRALCPHPQRIQLTGGPQPEPSQVLRSGGRGQPLASESDAGGHSGVRIIQRQPQADRHHILPPMGTIKFPLDPGPWPQDPQPRYSWEEVTPCPTSQSSTGLRLSESLNVAQRRFPGVRGEFGQQGPASDGEQITTSCQGRLSQTGTMCAALEQMPKHHSP